jgi:hypothetical protein
MNTVSKIRPVKVCSTDKRFASLAVAALVFLLSAGCIVPGVLDGDRRATVESLQVTATAEALLTETYRTEISSTIENFEIQWHSLEAHTNPGVQAEVATGPFLRCHGNARYGEAIYDEPFWLPITSAKVKNVRVIEYSSERFRAVASVAKRVNKMTPDGVILEASRPAGHCGIYV